MERSCSLFFSFLKRTTAGQVSAQAIATVVSPGSIVQSKALFFPFLCWAGITQSLSSVQGFWRTWARAFKKLQQCPSPLRWKQQWGKSAFCSSFYRMARNRSGCLHVFLSFLILPRKPYGMRVELQPYPISLSLHKVQDEESGTLIVPEDTGGWGHLASLPRTVKVKGHN